MPSFYDLLKYAATGIASPEMTAYDKMRAVAMAGGKVKTLTGVPPLSFRANGKPLISWSMLGNGQQNGTPAPDAPIMPDFVGEKTENLFDGMLEKGVWDTVDTLTQTTSDVFRSFKRNTPVGTYTISFEHAVNIVRLIKDGTVTWNVATNVTSYTITSTIAGDIGFSFRLAESSSILWDNSNVMLNLGSTPLPYEPYGWAIPITSAGQTVPVYLGQVQTTRRVKKLVLDGTEDWSNQTVHTTTSVSIVKPANGVLRPKTVLILSSDFIATDEASQSNPFVVGKMYVGSYYISFNYDGANNLDTWKSHLAERYASGNPICIWYVLAEPITAIVNEPLCKIGDYADTLDSADAGITIPTTRGSNVLTVGTDLKPSSMTITYR